VYSYGLDLGWTWLQFGRGKCHVMSGVEIVQILLSDQSMSFMGRFLSAIEVGGQQIPLFRFHTHHVATLSIV